MDKNWSIGFNRSEVKTSEPRCWSFFFCTAASFLLEIAPNWRLVPLDADPQLWDADAQLCADFLSTVSRRLAKQSPSGRSCWTESCYTVGVKPGATKMHTAIRSDTAHHIPGPYPVYLLRRVRRWPIIFQGQASAHPTNIKPTSISIRSIRISGCQDKLQIKVPNNWDALLAENSWMVGWEHRA